MIEATIIANSVSAHTGQCITTFELEYPRFIHCFDSKTEILARIGDSDPSFISIKKAKELGAQVAQYDLRTNEISFVTPTAYIENTGTHKMVNFDKNKLSLSVTDKHRVLVNKRTTNNTYVPEVWTADRFLDEYIQCQLMQSGIYKGNQYYSKEEIALMVWFAADGTINGNQMIFHFTKERKINSVINLLNSLNIPFTRSDYECSTSIKIQSLAWASDCYDELGFKKLPKKALYMDMHSYVFVKQAILDSNGSQANQEFNSTSKTFAEQVQVLAHLHNDSVNLKFYGTNNSGLYKSKFKETNYISLRRDKDEFTSSIENTTVYCVTVPSSFVMVRRNGIVHISGNCELMTHRQFSRNAASSRAIPIDKMIEQVISNTANPVHWGLNQSGMQAKDEQADTDACKEAWCNARDSAIHHAYQLKNLGLHKQIVNRVLEPFQMMRTLVTATSFDNFFNLRCHPDAQPEIKQLADLMYEAMQESEPEVLYAGEWHTPYVKHIRTNDNDTLKYYILDNNGGMKFLTKEEAIKISCSCAAQVSYRKNDTSIEKALSIYDKLVNSEPVHASAFEHCATPIHLSAPEQSDGITHVTVDKQIYSGNFTNWVQYRQLIKNHDCKKYKGGLSND